MAVRDILLLGNPVLREKCDRVKKFSDTFTRSIATDLRDTLADFRRRNGFGRGIAAPQIGITSRVVFVNVDKPIAMFNPRLTNRSAPMMTLWDDCFSFPDIMVKVRRHVSVTAEYQDEEGHPHLLKASGGLSELLQHEVDHIDGILAIDRAVDSSHIILRSEWKKLTDSHLRAL